ncbi:MAG: triose-phosphate isomerase [Dehalococcoidia bacterium]|nr:triose-phosphate isomerase [Dehalococcoidia bacterium]
MRIPLIAGNWKMNTTVAEAQALLAQMSGALGRIEGVEILLCPPFVSLATIKGMLQGTTIRLGAQNMYWEDKGAFTGEISSLMLSPLCQYVILGHSERRHVFQESDEVIACKVRSALRAHLRPIICVGERLEENEAGQTREVIGRQLKSALTGIGDIDSLVVAYEPVWAIGTGRAATGEQARATSGFIRLVLGELFGQAKASSIRIIYGGSVTAANVAEFLCQPDIDGALVGGASLKALEFISIADQAAGLKGRR